MTPVCSVCSNRTAPSYYKVSHLAQDGSEAPITTTCSVLCLLRWGQQFAALQSTKLAWNVKTALAGLIDKLR